MERAVLGASNFIFEVFVNEDSSSDSDNEMEINNMLINMETRSRQRDPSRVPNFIEITVPGFSDKQFQSHFRVTRTTFERLMTIIGNKLQKQGGRGRMRIDPEKQVLSIIWLLATPESYR